MNFLPLGMMMVGLGAAASLSGCSTHSSPAEANDAGLDSSLIGALDGGTDADAGHKLVPHEPKEHRAVAVPCDSVRPLVEPDPPGVDAGTPGVECTKNADCTAGMNGRCEDHYNTPGWLCTYDQCTTDAECGGGLCACEGGIRSNYNVCLHDSNCRVDADCGAGGYCSPVYAGCGGTLGYYCHTPDDECIDSTDCFGCEYNLVAGRWTCSGTGCNG